MNKLMLCIASVWLVSCAATETTQDSAGPTMAQRSIQSRSAEKRASAARQRAAEIDREDLVVVETVAAEDQPDIVCRKEVRPGTRIVIGETCYPRGQLGISAETREYLQREMSGQGWASGWKTHEQIEVERRQSLLGR